MEFHTSCGHHHRLFYPKSVEALNNKGITLADLGRHEEAIVWIDKALAVD
ncbi:MAG TPA: tetratricopeptide repeat protein [Nitrososphaeraceae archaeon]|nr:tetratricopeptide repeat protein [Nitrososphaeraceae archaeon]